MSVWKILWLDICEIIIYVCVRKDLKMPQCELCLIKFCECGYFCWGKFCENVIKLFKRVVIFNEIYQCGTHNDGLFGVIFLWGKILRSKHNCERHKNYHVRKIPCLK